MSVLINKNLVIGNITLSFEAKKEKPDFDKKYAKKSWFTFEQYTPQKIQELLNRYSKLEVINKLGINYGALNSYIEKHNLTYTPPAKRNKEKVKEYQKEYHLLSQKISQVAQQKTNIDTLTPLEAFKKAFEERKLQRTKQALQNPYYEYN